MEPQCIKWFINTQTMASFSLQYFNVVKDPILFSSLEFVFKAYSTALESALPKE